MIIHKGTNSIETIRLILRRFRIDDEYEMYKNWASDAEVCKFLYWGPHKNITVTSKRVKDITEHYKHLDYYNWALYLKSIGEIIGSISVEIKNDNNKTCEIGYCIGRDYWNQGLMTEALRSIMHYMFYEVGYQKIYAKHDIQNPASGRVMEKVGMRFDKYLHNQSFRRDKSISKLVVYVKSIDDD